MMAGDSNSGKFILAIDQGTTGTTSIVFDKKTKIVGRAYSPVKQIYPKLGWVEHDPLDIWQGVLNSARQAIQKANITFAQIEAIGITNQRETVVIWDKATGQPVHNAIVWQDRRTADLCDRLKEESIAADIRDRTGLVIDPYFSGTKVNWLLNHVDGLQERAERGEVLFGTVDSWLMWNLSGGKVHVTDLSNASRTLLFDIHKLAWDEEILNYFKIPASMLPKVCPNSYRFGEVPAGLLAEDSPAIPICGVAGDQQAALFGQACFEKGNIKTTYGTGAFMLLNTGTEPKKSVNGLLTTIAWSFNDQVVYALEGSAFIAGAAVQWLRDELKLIEHSGDTEQMALSVPDNGGVYLVPAFVGMGAPYWDHSARGALFGLTRGSSRNHLARAALEGIAYQVRDVLEALKEDSGLDFDEMKVDGGAAANNFLIQFQADMLDRQVIRPKVIETTALGAAYLAGLEVGYWTSQDEIKQLWQVDRVFEPELAPALRDKYYAAWKKAVKRSLEWEDDEE
jgi:glycerol kinase